MSSRVLVLDIETVRDPAVWTPPADQPDAFAPPYAHRPIVVGCVLLERSGGGWRPVRVGAISSAVERDVLGRFAAHLAATMPTLVTWNGRRFDLPVLMLRSMRLGIPSAWYYTGRDFRYRYTEAGHCDLADAMSDYGASPPLNLDGCAKLIGLPGKHGPIDGAGVGRAFEEGRLDEIARYCISDAVQTAFLWLRWELHTGQLGLAGYQISAEALLEAAAVELPELAQLIDRDVLLLPEQPATATEATA